MDPSAVVVLVAVILARLVVPLSIPRFPLPAILGAIVIDPVDQTIFQAFGEIDIAAYQTCDKALDIYYLTIAHASTIRNWGGGRPSWSGARSGTTGWSGSRCSSSWKAAGCCSCFPTRSCTSS